MSATTVTDYLTGIDTPLREIGERLRPIIDAALPGATGAMWHGHPVWSLGEKPGQNPVCLLKGQKSYVTFGLWRGQQVSDASGRLVPGAREMASVKLHTLDDIDSVVFANWLHQAQKLETK